MSNRPFYAARFETVINRRVVAFARRRGWCESVTGYVGYGNHKHVRVLGRITLVPQRRPSLLSDSVERFRNRRGWRNFITVPAMELEATVTLGDITVTTTTDREGYLDVAIPGHGLSPGWHTVTISTEQAAPVEADVQVISGDVTFGVISDIDDTVISTWLPRPFIAAYNSFVLTESARQPVPGMADLYRQMLAEHPGAPIVYVSTGSWNTLPFLRRFLARHHFPSGPMLLTDWGPTNTGWFRSGQDHKRNALRHLAQDFPKISWVLVGDDGQHDPMLYAEFAKYAPTRVRAIALRHLGPVEQVLAHGTPGERFDTAQKSELRPVAPQVEGPDGYTLARRLRDVLKPD